MITRHQINLQLAELLLYLIDKNPTMRFSQILQNFGFIVSARHSVDGMSLWANEFYTESEYILKRVSERVENSKTLITPDDAG